MKTLPHKELMGLPGMRYLPLNYCFNLLHVRCANYKTLRTDILQRRNLNQITSQCSRQRRSAKHK